MIYVVWLLLILSLALFAWFSHTKSIIVTTVFCLLAFPLLFGVRNISNEVPECRLQDQDYIVRGYKVTMTKDNSPDLVYVFLDGSPPVMCYIPYTDEFKKKAEEQEKKKGQGGQLIISGGNEFDIRFPEEREPKT